MSNGTRSPEGATPPTIAKKVEPPESGGESEAIKKYLKQ